MIARDELPEIEEENLDEVISSHEEELNFFLYARILFIIVINDH